MKDNLPCAVVRDLLPIYVEGLTEPETNAAVEAHLKTCPACTARLAAMRAPEPPPEAETAKEVDYLKKVKRRSWKRVVLAVLITVLVLMGALAAKLFLLGNAAGPESMVFYVEQSDETLSLRISSAVSANAYWGWNTKSQDGVVEISAREGLVSPLHSTASAKLDIPLEGVQEVYLCGRLIWQEGTITAGQALKQFETLYEARTPYVGNPSALNEVAQALNLSRLGSYTFRLQTGTEPYGWTVDFTQEIEGLTNELMPYLAPQMLAVVGNLGTVSWTCPDDQGNPQTHTITLEEVNARLAELTDAYNDANGTDWETLESVKDYAQSPVMLQRLDAIFWQVYVDAVQAAGTDY
ncbi:DUF4825 domain-containing protein [Dysosmobacter sp.]|uniref:DUF4825 domain-containing protein n=1 Tax=Dysosmobacter sp. TaxID=2591382 RepID=UPI0026185AAA|nr:DUF4825 domain-containing protein [Dysosmobacter sp.]